MLSPGCLVYGYQLIQGTWCLCLHGPRFLRIVDTCVSRNMASITEERKVYSQWHEASNFTKCDMLVGTSVYLVTVFHTLLRLMFGGI